MERNPPIGIFDSGVGGLTVYRALKRALPNEHYLYLGDTARLPYGTKTADTVTRYSLQAAKKLIHAGVQFLVIACNTATASSLEAVRAAYPEVPIIGVIEPGAETALSASKNKHIAVIATPATVRAQGYEQAIHALDPTAQVLSLATPLLVALAEEGLITGEIPTQILHHYLNPWLNLIDGNRPDTLILGCTHFPVLEKTINLVIGHKMQVIDSAASVASKVKAYFDKHPNLKNQTGQGHTEFWVTDGVERFIDVAHVFLDEKISPKQVHLIDLG